MFFISFFISEEYASLKIFTLMYSVLFLLCCATSFFVFGGPVFFVIYGQIFLIILQFAVFFSCLELYLKGSVLASHILAGILAVIVLAALPSRQVKRNAVVETDAFYGVATKAIVRLYTSRNSLKSLQTMNSFRKKIDIEAIYEGLGGTIDENNPIAVYMDKNGDFLFLNELFLPRETNFLP
jgi:hypothetical protein